MVWRFAKANESKGKKRWSEKKTEENTIKTYAYFNKIFFFASCCYIRCVRGCDYYSIRRVFRFFFLNRLLNNIFFLFFSPSFLFLDNFSFLFILSTCLSVLVTFSFRFAVQSHQNVHAVYLCYCSCT